MSVTFVLDTSLENALYDLFDETESSSVDDELVRALYPDVDDEPSATG